MNSIPIPKKFSLFGHSCKVKLMGKVNKGKDYAEWDFDKKLIKLTKESKDFSKEQQEEYFLHEALHGCLDILGYSDLSNDEKFIEQLSRALHQMLKSAEY